MAITNHERVGKSLEHLKAGLGPFVEREIHAAIAANAAKSGNRDPFRSQHPLLIRRQPADVT